MLDSDAILNLQVDTDILRAAELVETALSSAPTLLQKGGHPLVTIWGNLRMEVYDLLCTQSAKYKTERDLFKATVKPATASLAAYLTRGFGMPIAAASALASLALLLPFKMLTLSWCETAKKVSITEEELHYLKQLRKDYAESLNKSRSRSSSE